MLFFIFIALTVVLTLAAQAATLPPSVGALQASRLILIDETTGEQNCLQMRLGSIYVSPGDCRRLKERPVPIATAIIPLGGSRGSRDFSSLIKFFVIDFPQWLVSFL